MINKNTLLLYPAFYKCSLIGRHRLGVNALDEAIFCSVVSQLLMRIFIRLASQFHIDILLR